ncbi:MAG: TIM barrel protein [Patescibacteria group bacterium]
MFKLGMRAIYQKNIEAAILEAKRLGFKVLEIHLSAPQFLIAQYSAKRILAIKKIAEKEGIILQTHAPAEFSLIFVDENLRQGARKQLKEMIKFSQALGARALTLHPGKAAIFHQVDGEKIKDDDLYSKFYCRLFEDSIKDIISIAPKNLFICIENTDNFNLGYQKILDKYLRAGKIFLTWDIRKNFDFTTNKLIKEQWNFVVKNQRAVKNLHVSGLGAGHGKIDGWEKQLKPFFKLFRNCNLPLIIEVLPKKETVKAKNIIEKIYEK